MRDEFLTWFDTRQRDAELALLNGDPEPRRALWSHSDPVTLYGADFSGSGWPDITDVFAKLGVAFSDCTSYERELLAADVSGDLGYTVTLDRIDISINGRPRPHVLRVTQVYRREDGEWKIVHRHADPPPTPTFTVD